MFIIRLFYSNLNSPNKRTIAVIDKNFQVSQFIVCCFWNWSLYRWQLFIYMGIHFIPARNVFIIGNKRAALAENLDKALLVVVLGHWFNLKTILLAIIFIFHKLLRFIIPKSKHPFEHHIPPFIGVISHCRCDFCSQLPRYSLSRTDCVPARPLRTLM